MQFSSEQRERAALAVCKVMVTAKPKTSDELCASIVDAVLTALCEPAQAVADEAREALIANLELANARIEAALKLCDEAQQFEDSPDFEGNHYGCPGALHTSEVRAALTGKGKP